MNKLTDHQSNVILKIGSGWDNAKAMAFANEHQKALHSALVIEIGDMWSNAHAMKFTNPKQKKRHSAGNSG